MRKKIIISLSLVIILSMLSLVLFFLKNDKPGISYTQDEVNFKKEYESLNEKTIDNKVLVKTDIEDDNNVVYVYNYDRLIDLLENGTNIIYLGWADNNSCRVIISTLIDVLKNNNIDTLYYYDMKSLSNGYINNYDKYKEKYEGLVEILSSKVNTVFETDNELNGKKEISIPSVIFVKDGKIVGVYSNSIESHDDNKELTIDEKKLLEGKYQELLDIINADVCVESNEGC